MTPTDEKIIEILKRVGAEFLDLSDTDLLFWVELQKAAVSEKKFGADYPLAVALLACHAMKMAGNGDSSLGKISDTGRLASVSEGGVSISFASSTASASGDAELQLTSYGLQFIAIRSRHIIPITIR